MGFKNGAICTVFAVEPVSEKMTKVRVSISAKKPGSNPAEYVQDFGGFIRVLGAEPAKQAAKLRQYDRIKIDQTEVTTTFDKEKNKAYTDFKVFAFEKLDKPAPHGDSKNSPDDKVEEGDGYPF